MNCETVTMEPEKAQEALEAHRRAFRERGIEKTEVDRQIEIGYRVLAKGGRLLDVNDAIAKAGLNRGGQPRLAIARAHVASIRFSSYRTGGARFIWGKAWGTDKYNHQRWEVPTGTFAVRNDMTEDAGNLCRRDLLASVPLVPAALRPKDHIGNYFILWEAIWLAQPPVDPYLLKPIAGSLMQVIEEWNLTALERLVMKGTMIPR